MSENTLPKFQPRRPLGRTGFVATRLGIGDIADRNVPLEECVATVRRAMDAGLNLIDTAPGYEDGYSEEIVGRALQGRREGIFLIDKIDHLDRPLEEQLDGSLARLGVDRIDLVVFHALSRRENWHAITAPGGMMEQLGRRVEKGDVGFRGISSHDPGVLVEAIESGLCDVVLFAVGPYCDDRFITQVLPLARKRQVGTVCFKTFGAGKLLCDTEGYGRALSVRPRGKLSSGGQASRPLLPHLDVRQCVHYTLTCDPDVALLGMSFPNEQDAALAAAADFSPLSPQEMADLRRAAALAVQDKGRCWWNPDGP